MSNSAVSKFSPNLHDRAGRSTPAAKLDFCLPYILTGGALLLLFYQLGAAALFEPDEGRNAEKAREILLLRDWVTPHENFHPVLDKPIFFYWLIALCYKLFGVSEAAARLPSGLAALGCVAVVYWFARAHWGRAVALWSGLILLTCVEFFLLARLVIFDMAMTFAITLGLSAFYQASLCEDRWRRKGLCFLMYSAFGIATLIKGLIGVVLPGMVIFGYLLLTNSWPVLRRLYLIPGTLLFLAIVLPWYVEAGARHEGYLRYFFWEEHFLRFTRDAFNRGEPWYYFFFVAWVGFFPWSLLWPALCSRARWTLFDNKALFLILWAGLPFLFFSGSHSKLPHYILPIFPALALLSAARLVALFEASAERAMKALSLTWLAHAAVVLYFLVGHWLPAILPRALLAGVAGISRPLWFYGAALVALSAFFSFARFTRRWGEGQIYLAQMLIMTGFLILLTHAMFNASLQRSAKLVAQEARPLLTPETQVVVYDSYLAGLGFYLDSEKPLWVVTHSKKAGTFIGNYYVLGKRTSPGTRWGKALFEFDEFAARWRSAEQPLLVLAKAKNKVRLDQQVGAPTKVVASVHDYVWLVRH